MGGGRLWGLLLEQRPQPSLAAQAAAVEAEAESEAAVWAPPISEERPQPALATATAEESEATVAQVVVAAAAVAQPPEPGPGFLAEEEANALRASLQQAMRRVEALEARLSEHERRRAAEPSRPDGKEPMQAATFPGSWGWDTILPGGMAAVPAPGGGRSGGESTVSAGVQLHRPFNFEEFRRANSHRLQAERLRVLAPPDHFPIWPLPKK
mmetsp:Transcript_39378/g.83891  ORF Transcript_39378/g.83891 Transcript_39378/m.83891 type:complete len:211 (+) Transcript_39378:2-634(+)